MFWDFRASAFGIGVVGRHYLNFGSLLWSCCEPKLKANLSFKQTLISPILVLDACLHDSLLKCFRIDLWWRPEMSSQMFFFCWSDLMSIPPPRPHTPHCHPAQVVISRVFAANTRTHTQLASCFSFSLAEVIGITEHDIPLNRSRVGETTKTESALLYCRARLSFLSDRTFDQQTRGEKVKWVVPGASGAVARVLSPQSPLTISCMWCGNAR